MSTTTRRIVMSGAALAAAFSLGLGGYLLMAARAEGSGTSQPAAVAKATARPTPVASASVEPPVERWMVAKAVRPLTVYKRPSESAGVKARLGKRNVNDYPTVFLVNGTRQVDGRTWYDVFVAMRPNGSRGWIKEGDVAIYTTSALIEIDLSERTLTVFRRGEDLGTFPVAVGKPGLETPTGRFFVNQKLRPASPGGAFGALAIGISAFQMKLAASAWDQGGPVAIHGTDQPELIGQAVSHGCVRMRDKDVLKVSDWVPTGSPVVIHR